MVLIVIELPPAGDGGSGERETFEMELSMVLKNTWIRVEAHDQI